MARSTVSRGMLATSAAFTAARRRGLWSGSAMPWRAATVISRMSLPKARALRALWALFRCMMFLACEWPAMDLARAPEMPIEGRLIEQVAQGWKCPRAWERHEDDGRRRPRSGDAGLAGFRSARRNGRAVPPLRPVRGAHPPGG